jgi:hypothetical protein
VGIARIALSAAAKANGLPAVDGDALAPGDDLEGDAGGVITNVLPIVTMGPENGGIWTAAIRASMQVASGRLTRTPLSIVADATVPSLANAIVAWL